jgi:hypothetical protein
MTKSVNSSIFFSEKDNLLVFDSEPQPNVSYNVCVLENPSQKLKVKLVGSKVIINGGRVGGVKLSLGKRKRSEFAEGQAVYNWLLQRCPDIHILNNIKQNPETGQEQLIVKGYVQSGKTSFMLCSALSYMFGEKSMSSIIVLRNANGDQTQIKSRLNSMKDEISKHINTDLDFNLLDGTVSEDEFVCAMNGLNPQIFVVLGNGSRLRRVNMMLKKIKDPKFALFIDEADSNDTGENKRTDEIGYLKTMGRSLFYISATILDIGMRDQPVVEKESGELVVPMSASNVYMLEDVPNYMGLEKLIHRPLPHDALPCNKNEHDPFVMDPNLLEFINKFGTFQPHNVKMYNLNHPQHCLISAGTVIIPQKKIFSAVASFGECAVLIYNGDGIDFYHKSCESERILITTDGGRRVVGGKKCEWHIGAHTFGKTIGIAEMIQWMKDNGGVSRFPRIITISGKLAGRGISFVSSDYGKYLGQFRESGMPTFLGWRLTSMYYVPSPMTTQPNIMQAIGRACCVVRDNIPTYIYTNEEVFVDLRKAYWTQEELVIRARATQSGENIDISEALNKVRMNKSKLSKRRLTVTGKRNIAPENIVEWFEDDGGFKFEDTYNDVSVCDDGEWEYTSGDVIPDRQHELETLSMDPVEYQRLVGKMFPIWAKSETSISTFMQQLDPHKIYTTAELKEHCLHNSVRMGDVVFDVSGKSNKYGSIMQKVKGGYRLYCDLVKCYEANF